MDIRLLTKTTEVAETKNEHSLESKSPIVRTCICVLGLSVSAVPIVHPAWVKSVHFCVKKYVYVYLVNEELCPNLGKIVDLFTCDTDSVHVHVCVHIQECDTLYFSSHFNAFLYFCSQGFAHVHLS